MEAQTDSQFLLNKLEEIQRTFGFWIAASIIVAIIIAVVTFKLLIKHTEKIIEEKSEKSLKKFQNELDRDSFKFQTKHQKQIDSIQMLFQRFRRLRSCVTLLINGENFIVVTDVREELNRTVDCRHAFKVAYDENMIILPKYICEKIDAFFPAIDEFINTFARGILPEQSPEDAQRNADENGGLIIAGLWSANTFEPIILQLNTISEDIESEFRKIYGTAE